MSEEVYADLKALRMSAKAMTAFGDRNIKAVRRLARRTLNAVDEMERLRDERTRLITMLERIYGTCRLSEDEALEPDLARLLFEIRGEPYVPVRED